MQLRLLRPSLVVVTLCTIYLVSLVARAGTLRELIQPGWGGHMGYDGQFTYFYALDPFTAPDKVGSICFRQTFLPRYVFQPDLHKFYQPLWECDFPAYRAQRILHAAISRIFGFGQPDLVILAMTLTNLLALGLGTAAAAGVLQSMGVNKWFALLFGLTPGFFLAPSTSTTETVAYALVALALYAHTRKQIGWMSVFFALAALAKETTLFFPAGYCAYLLFNRQWRTMFLVGIVSLLPFLAWQAVLYVWLGSVGIGSGGAGGTPFEFIPYNGVFWLLRSNDPVFQARGLITVLSVLVPSVWAMIYALRDLFGGRTPQTRLFAWLLLANAVIMPFVPLSTYFSQFAIARFLPGFALAVLVYAAQVRRMRPSVWRFATAFGVLWILWMFLLAQSL